MLEAITSMDPATLGTWLGAVVIAAIAAFNQERLKAAGKAAKDPATANAVLGGEYAKTIKSAVEDGSIVPLVAIKEEYTKKGTRPEEAAAQLGEVHKLLTRADVPTINAAIREKEEVDRIRKATAKPQNEFEAEIGKKLTNGLGL